jgi:signal transduction histidine kinase
VYAAQAEELAIERERTRLAREVHDGVGHVLMTVNMQIEAARAHFDNDPVSARESLSVAQRYIKDAAAEVRRSIATLRTPALEVRPLPLPEMVAVLAETARSSMLDVYVQVEGAPRPLPPQTSFALNRVVQEALTNVRKHARASKAIVTLDYSDAQHVRVNVRDNGVGATTPGSGYGLIGIHERMQTLGGTATTRSEPGGGFSVMVEVPV